MENSYTNTNINIEKNNQFFTKKKIITFSILLVVFVVFIVLTSKFFFDINFKVIFDLFQKSIETNRLFALWFILLFLFPFYHTFFRIVVYKYKLRKHNIFVAWYNWLFFCFITFFIDNITPFAMGSQPYIIYWLKKQGLQLQDATAIVASMTFLNPGIQVIITWPSFFYLCSMYSANINDPIWIGCFWAVFVGLIIDLIGVFFWIALSYSKRAHYLINLIINKLKKLFKMKYKQKEEIKEEFINNSSFKKKVIKEMKDWKYLLIVVIGSLLWNVIYYSSIIFAFNLIDNTFSFNSFDLFNFVNVATTANNFIPIPGAEGTIQASISIFIQNSSHNLIASPEQLKLITNNSVFIWRTFTFYLPTILGLLWFIMLIIKEAYKNIMRKKRYKLDPKDRTFTVVIPYYNTAEYVMRAINSINNINYDKDLIQVIIVNDGSTNKADCDLLEKLPEQYPFIEVHNKKNGQWGSVINYVKKKKLIKHQYVSILDSDDYLDKNVFYNINLIPNEYDIYCTQFRKFSANKVKKIVNPFWYLYKKSFVNKQQMNTPFAAPLNYFIRTEVFLKMHDLVEKIPYQDTDFLSQMMLNAKNMRYLRRVGAFYYFNRPNNSVSQAWNDKRYDAELIACQNCINNNAQEIVSYRLSQKGFLDQVKKHNQVFTIKRKFSFKWYPWYIRPLYYIYHEIRFRKYFKYEE